MGGAGNLTAEDIRALARECGFDLAGVVRKSNALELMRSVGLEI
jgi:hypothetical protein